MEAPEIRIVEEARKPLAMHPKKFALWLFIATVVMLFGAWTSAYIVKRGDTGWAEVALPEYFWVNTVIIVASSITMFWAVRVARKNNQESLKLAMMITTLLGFGFMIGQYLAFGEMVALKEFFAGGPVSHSFVYILSGAHALHVLGGVIYLSIITSQVFKKKIHSGNMDSIEMCATYWHFLDLLWLYLFVFLMINR